MNVQAYAAMQKLISPTKPTQTKGEASIEKNPALAKFQTGDVIEAKVISQKDGNMTMRTSDGIQFTARQGQSPMPVGQQVQMMVTDKSAGMIRVEIASLPNVDVPAMLESFGAENSKQNQEIAKEMTAQKMPLTKENFQSVQQAVTTHKSLSSEQAVFMQNNKIPITPQNIQQFHAQLQNENQLGAKLATLVKIFEQIPQMSSPTASTLPSSALTSNTAVPTEFPQLSNLNNLANLPQTANTANALPQHSQANIPQNNTLPQVTINVPQQAQLTQTNVVQQNPTLQQQAQPTQTNAVQQNPTLPQQAQPTQTSAVQQNPTLPQQAQPTQTNAVQQNPTLPQQAQPTQTSVAQQNPTLPQQAQPTQTSVAQQNTTLPQQAQPTQTNAPQQNTTLPQQAQPTQTNVVQQNPTLPQQAQPTQTNAPQQNPTLPQQAQPTQTNAPQQNPTLPQQAQPTQTNALQQNPTLPQQAQPTQTNAPQQNPTLPQQAQSTQTNAPQQNPTLPQQAQPTQNSAVQQNQTLPQQAQPTNPQVYTQIVDTQPLPNTNQISKYEQSTKSVSQENTPQPPIKELIETLFKRVDPDRKLDLSQDLTAPKLLKELNDLLEAIDRKLPDIPESTRNEVVKTVREMEQSVKFMEQLNNYTAFVQLPLTLNGEHTTADLYVFNDSKNKKKIDPQNATLFLSLSTANMGRVESFVKVIGKNIECDFKLMTQEQANLFASSMNELGTLLGTEGYTLARSSANVATSPSDVLDIAKEREARKGKYSFNRKA